MELVCGCFTAKPHPPLSAHRSVCSAEDTVVPAGGKALVSTGLSMTCPPGTYGRVAPRSGLAVKNFIDTGAGVVDEDYTGEVRVLLFNHSDQDFPGGQAEHVASRNVEAVSWRCVVRALPALRCAATRPQLT